jgi:hypothetical protein
MKIKYNSPVILTYTIISIAVLILTFSNAVSGLFTSPAILSFSDPLFYENPAEYPAIYGGDECGAGVRGMKSHSLPSIMPRFLKRGSLLFTKK